MGIFTSFYDDTGEHGDIVMSSRVRLARNIDGVPYPVRLNAARKMRIVAAAGEVLSAGDRGFRTVEVSNLYPYEAVALAERHLLPPDFVSGTENRTAFISEDDSVTVVMNDTDHVRIQAIAGGLRLEDSLAAANEIDDALDARLHFAFDNRLGYLNQQLSNIGTGMRASVLLHLPALGARGEMNRISSLVTRLGINIRGNYGEGAAAKGDIYRMSNSICMGLGGEEAVQNLKAIVMQVATRERAAAEELVGEIAVKDKILRAWALVKNAMLLDNDETYEMLSLVRMGAVYGLIDVKPSIINELFIFTQNACLCTLAGMKLTHEQCCELRAKIIRENLGDK